MTQPYDLEAATGQLNMDGKRAELKYRWLLLSVSAILTVGGIAFSRYHSGSLDAVVAAAAAVGGILGGYVGIKTTTKQ
jgi:hypothetical protein